MAALTAADLAAMRATLEQCLVPFLSAQQTHPKLSLPLSHLAAVVDHLEIMFLEVKVRWQLLEPFCVPNQAGQDGLGGRQGPDPGRKS